MRRYLGIVICDGQLATGHEVTAVSDVFPAAPVGFRARTAWAVDQIPIDRYVTSLDLLTTIGATKSYARVLPRWLRDASASGSAVHKVLTAGFAPGSWATDEALFELPGRARPAVAEAHFSLAQAIWSGGN